MNGASAPPRLSIAAAAVIAACLLAPASGWAAIDTRTVNSNLDPGDGSCATNGCTLEEAINELNDGDTADQDQIHLSFSIALPNRIVTLAGTLPTIDEPLAIDSTGLGVPIISGNDLVRPFLIDTAPGDDVRISEVVVSNGATTVAGQHGGGISSLDADLTIADATIASNDSTETGGGIFATGGSLTLERSVVADNTADTNGGGVNGASSLVQLRRSTISGNHTEDASAPGGGLISNGTATIANSTISGNWTEGSNSGGGGLNVANATIASSTINANETNGASSPGGGVVAGTADPVLVNTIVANNLVSGGGVNSDLGSLSANGEHQLAYTLVETVPDAGNYNETVPGSNLFVDPALGPLEDNNGGAFTHMPGPTSPAIDKGSSDEATDQRGLARPRDFLNRSNPDDGSDMGAVEVQIAPPTFAGTTPASPSTDDTPEVRGGTIAAPEIDDGNPLVQLFTGPSCTTGATGAATAPGPFAGPGITVDPVAHNATTTFHAQLTTDHGQSPCSPTSISYTQADPVSSTTPVSSTPVTENAACAILRTKLARLNTKIKRSDGAQRTRLKQKRRKVRGRLKTLGCP